jgi:hypothetical protein
MGALSYQVYAPGNINSALFKNKGERGFALPRNRIINVNQCLPPLGTMNCQFLTTRAMTFATTPVKASTLVLLPPAPTINLLRNSGFETGDSTNWKLSGTRCFISSTRREIVRSGQFGAAIDDPLVTGSFSQSFTIPDTNELLFGAYIRLFTIENPRELTDFGQVQILLTIPSANLIQTVEIDPNEVADSFSFNCRLNAFQTRWILLQSALTVPNLTGQVALFNLTLYNFPTRRTSVALDDAFVC